MISRTLLAVSAAVAAAAVSLVTAAAPAPAVAPHLVTHTSSAPGGSGPVIDLRASHPASVLFASPTGRITCDLERSATGTIVRCDVSGAVWKVPNPEGCYPMSEGDSVTATPTRTSLTCHTDTLGGAARLGSYGTGWISTPAGRRFGSRLHGNATLPYGVTILTSSTSGCVSRVTGVTCWDGRTSITQRFSVARYSYTLRG